MNGWLHSIIRIKPNYCLNECRQPWHPTTRIYGPQLKLICPTFNCIIQVLSIEKSKANQQSVIALSSVGPSNAYNRSVEHKRITLWAHICCITHFQWDASRGKGWQKKQRSKALFTKQLLWALGFAPNIQCLFRPSSALLEQTSLILFFHIIFVFSFSERTKPVFHYLELSVQLWPNSVGLKNTFSLRVKCLSPWIGCYIATLLHCTLVIAHWLLHIGHCFPLATIQCKLNVLIGELSPLLSIVAFIRLLLNV